MQQYMRSFRKTRKQPLAVKKGFADIYGYVILLGGGVS
jgi:hypothetical protein